MVDLIHFTGTFISPALSPLGFIQDGRNLNYYDIKDWKSIFKEWCVNMISLQLSFLHTSKAYCIGTGINHKFLLELNEEHQFFETIITLPRSPMGDAVSTAKQRISTSVNTSASFNNYSFRRALTGLL